MRKLLIVSALSVIVSGCASFPANFDSLPDTTQIQRDISTGWNAIPAISHVEGQTGFEVQKTYPIPQNILDEDVEYEFASNARLSDLVFVLSSQGYTSVLRGIADSERLLVPFFKGKMHDLIKALAVSHDIAVEYRDGVLIFRDSARYTITVPQNRELIDRIASHVSGLGATSTQGDLDSGLVSFLATPSAHESISSYIERAARNAAMVMLQVAVIDVRLNRDLSTGFDWNEFSVNLGSLVNTPTEDIGRIMRLSGNGVSFRLGQANFTVNAAVRALSRYGTARTDQDVMLSTLAGSSVRIRSGNSIPYVENIGAVSSDGSVSGSASTSTVNSGLTIELLPYYDTKANVVTTNINVDLSSLVGFRELNAGSNLGSLSQPEIQELTFENITRLTPGEVAVLGGIAYDQVASNYTSLPGLERLPINSRARNSNRHALFIVVRPTVTLFSQRPKDIEQIAVITEAIEDSYITEKAQVTPSDEASNPQPESVVSEPEAVTQEPEAVTQEPEAVKPQAFQLQQKAPPLSENMTSLKGVYDLEDVIQYAASANNFIKLESTNKAPDTMVLVTMDHEGTWLDALQSLDLQLEGRARVRGSLQDKVFQIIYE